MNFQRGSGRGFGRGRGSGRGVRGTDTCTCPKCGKKVPHTRGIPCSSVKCPECGTLMRGEFCL